MTQININSELSVQNLRNTHKTSFMGNQYANSKSLHNDTVSFSNNGNDDINGGQGGVLSAFSRFVKNLFGKNDTSSQTIDHEEYETHYEEPIEETEEEIAQREQWEREYEESVRKTRAEEDARDAAYIKEHQKPMFTEHTVEELKDIFGKFENKTSSERQGDFDYLLRKKYKELRESGNYSEEESINCMFSAITPWHYDFESENGTWSYHKDGWFWHEIKNGNQKLSTDRVSLSVKADDVMLRDLDQLLTNGSYRSYDGWHFVPYDKFTKGYYKTSDSIADWCKRHDPITIYFDEKVSPEMLDALAEVTRFYRRLPQKKLPGEVDGKPWIANEPYIAQAQINSLVEEANKVDNDLARAIRKYLGNNASTGMYHSCVNLLEEYSRYKSL